MISPSRVDQQWFGTGRVSSQTSYTQTHCIVGMAQSQWIKKSTPGVFGSHPSIRGTLIRELQLSTSFSTMSDQPVDQVLTLSRDLNKQATGAAPSSVLRAMTSIMRCLGILDEQAKGAWSSLFAIAGNGFKDSDSGAYVVPYRKFGEPSLLARDAVLSEKLWDWTVHELGDKGLLDRDI